MTTKLTLTIEELVIESAKKYARKKGKSLSELVENYLKSVSNKEGDDEERISPKILKLRGVIKLPRDYNYKEDLGKALVKKYTR